MWHLWLAAQGGEETGGIVEVGFSEVYVDLERDALQWLMKGWVECISGWVVCY